MRCRSDRWLRSGQLRDGALHCRRCDAPTNDVEQATSDSGYAGIWGTVWLRPGADGRYNERDSSALSGGRDNLCDRPVLRRGNYSRGWSYEPDLRVSQCECIHCILDPLWERGDCNPNWKPSRGCKWAERHYRRSRRQQLQRELCSDHYGHQYIHLCAERRK